MIFIQHRVNTLSQLELLAPGVGAEIDLRAGERPGSVLLHHDPWNGGEDFEAWLKCFKQKPRGPLVLNTKEDGLEAHLISTLEREGVSDYFFIDTPAPTFIKWFGSDKRAHFAERLSKHEPMVREGATWVWLDCFDGDPAPSGLLKDVASRFRICIVSPELHGHAYRISEFNALREFASAVCGKNQKLWS